MRSSSRLEDSATSSGDRPAKAGGQRLDLASSDHGLELAATHTQASRSFAKGHHVFRLL